MEDANVAVCLLPGTELSFEGYVRRARTWPWSKGTIEHRTAIFRQINKEISRAHHDAVEFSDGKIVLLTLLKEGQQATVLQLPVVARHLGTWIKGPLNRAEPIRSAHAAGRFRLQRFLF